MKLTTEQRFWSKVDKSTADGCWTWRTRSPSASHLYPSFLMEGRNVSAHRASWILANGPIPDGLWVLHRCDNPPCIRPDHLFLGTHVENVRDMVSRGRSAAGDRNGWRRLLAGLPTKTTKGKKRRPLGPATGDRNGSRIHPETRPTGDIHASGKITSADVIRILARYAVGDISQKKLAAEFGLSKSQTGRILRGQTWRRLDRPVITIGSFGKSTSRRREKCAELRAAKVVPLW